MDTRAYIIIAFVLLAVITGYIAMEWSNTGGHWNNAGDNWSR